MKNDKKQCCDNCMFSIQKVKKISHHGEPHYYCRRYPPSPIADFPETFAESWCGEYKRKGKMKYVKKVLHK